MKPVFWILMFSCIGIAHASEHVHSPLPTCRSMSIAKFPCYTVHGRLGRYFGNPEWRIWPVGSHRLLGVVPDPDDSRYMPVGPLPSLTADDSSVVFGDFEVCPLSPDKPGQMRDVCISSVSNIVVETRGPDGKDCRIRKVD